MSGIEIRELEAFLALARELHFGRAGERLYVSQSRVSQLLRSLESRIGAPLVERTSRRVRLTPLGESFLAGLRPAYDALRATVDEARAAARGTGGELRIGFQGTVEDHLGRAIARFGDRYPDCAIDLVEIPLSDPFGPLRRREVDCAVVLLPVAEDDLVVGPVFSRRPQTLAVSVRHPFAARDSLSAEELAECRLIGPDGDAPAYWRRAQAPDQTPGGLPVPAGPGVNTLQEGLSLTAANRGAMLLCRATADYHARHDSLAFVPVRGLPDSELCLIRPRLHPSPQAEAFAREIRGRPRDPARR
ncbi:MULTISPECIES: LysR family transcriptional regulator [unclassified Streptomyces]|uniref:LysR family transcriptional regulator n=1 Tax=unclassified Streptomyces TaxID=2593676 RepID=UPI0022571264|nr:MULTISPECIES: LysR family transcriptional regulator [unclassified Streptomyces]MCX4529581.1 LysR family transcriptional regulator [Streptomyces sp. NBC_01551]MCX4539846.1 LysR family transcriptional regulator [Streptomyces sp. NBC_01565]